MKHELKYGMKFKFSGPIQGSNYFYENKLVKVKNIYDDVIDVVSIDTNVFLGTIHRRQVVSVFVKKPKKEKLTVFVAKYYNGKLSRTSNDTLERVKGLYASSIDEIIEFKEVRRHKIKG